LSFEKQPIAQGDGFQIVTILLAISLYIIRSSDEPPEKSGQPLAGISIREIILFLGLSSE
jgi:hypothetical protein